MPVPGWRNLPFTTGWLSDVDRDYLNSDFANAFSAFTGQQRAAQGPGTFTDWLMASRGLANNLYNQFNDRRVAEGGGFLSQLTPLEWLQKHFDALGTFQSFSPRERGENPGAYSPFTRYLGGR